jgi:hypothetical protein
MTTRALALCSTLVALAPTGALADTKLAPADEYFGHMKMSPIEITNRITDSERGSASYNWLSLTQNAIEDWTHKYPADPWIPSREYRLAELFVTLHTPAGDAAAAHCRNFLHRYFPRLHFHFVAAIP